MLLIPIMIVYGIFVYSSFFHSFLHEFYPVYEYGFFALCLLTFCLWIYLIFSDPGHIVDKYHRPLASIENAQRFKSAYEEVMKGQSYNTKMLCATCEIERPNRSKHCIICDTCVLKMDHHCIPFL